MSRSVSFSARIARHRQPVLKTNFKRGVEPLVGSRPHLGVEKILDWKRVGDRAGKHDFHHPALFGFVVALHLSGFRRARDGTDGTNQAERVVRIEHFDIQQTDLFHLGFSRLLPKLHQRLAQHAFRAKG